MRWHNCSEIGKHDRNDEWIKSSFNLGYLKHCDYFSKSFWL